ncbi:hypothetical protein SAMN05421811_10456 [Nonomuraea wenchangensis]|uniref:Phage integrase family protein n=1 Tax=Nonomuraea wenchangensis TaxID=568860 RepID=A0A1I0H2V9_9ACTN|nr:hypothetical protein SAMN05421811_10456 [Nonomuraea wenchangensis]
MGHSSTQAALIYQHSTDERQREVARKLGALDNDPSGWATGMALKTALAKIESPGH